MSSPVSPGQNAYLVARTVPDAICAIQVYYKNGISEAKGLEQKMSGADGMVRWDWKVGPGTSTGTWKIHVAVSKDGETVSVEIPFVVQ